MYADYKLDESYTPSKISVRCGTNFHDLQVSQTFLLGSSRTTELQFVYHDILQKVTTIEIEEPEGWVDIDTVNENEQ